MTASGQEDWLATPGEALGRGTGIGFSVVEDRAALVQEFARQMLAEFAEARAAGRQRVLFIVPVGPTGQYDILADLCMAQRLSLRGLTLLGMDEYLAPDGGWIAEADPLSFRGHLRRHLVDRMDPDLAPRVIFPHPDRLAEPAAEIAAHGGVDVCFGGVGMCGHIAFNEPPEPGEVVSVEAFAARPTRVLRLSRETRTINAATATGGDIALLPDQAVTVGMREILSARRIRLFLHRPWQRGVVRRMMHGPVTAAVPASLIQRHGDVAVVATRDVLPSPVPVVG